MKSAHFLVFLVVLLGLAGGYLAYPRPLELALMHYKNQQFSIARTAYENLLNEGDISANVVLPLSDLYLIHGEMDKAVALMEIFVRYYPDNMQARLRLSRFYQQTQRPHDYIASLEKRLEMQPSEEVLRTLSQLYNTEGRYLRQIEVLRRIIREYEAAPRDYADLAYLLSAEGEMVEASDILQKLAQDHPAAFDMKAREFLVSLFLDLGQYEKAITYLQDYGYRGGRWAAYYEQALIQTGHYAELFSFWERQLARPDVSAEEKREISYRYENVLRTPGYEEKRLDFLRRQLMRPGLDDRERKEINSRYEAALLDTGRRDELRALLWRRLNGSNLDRKEKLALASRALELGDKQLAERVYMELSVNASPDSDEVEQLLYLWGPRPEPSRLEWLEERARNTQGEWQLGWLKRLLDAGAVRRVLALIQQELTLTGYNNDLVGLQMDILQQQEDYTHLYSALKRAISSSRNAEQLRRHSRRAEQAGFMTLSLEANKRLLAITPNAPEILHRLGLLAYQEGEWDEAFRMLGRYLENSRGDIESNYFYAELLTRRGEIQQARPHYREVLRLLAAEPELDMQKAGIQAWSLYRLGERDSAILAFQKLLVAYPGNADLRADFASILIETGHADQAARILSAGEPEI